MGTCARRTQQPAGGQRRKTEILAILVPESRVLTGACDSGRRSPDALGQVVPSKGRRDKGGGVLTAQVQQLERCHLLYCTFQLAVNVRSSKEGMAVRSGLGTPSEARAPPGRPHLPAPQRQGFTLRGLHHTALLSWTMKVGRRGIPHRHGDSGIMLLAGRPGLRSEHEKHAKPGSVHCKVRRHLKKLVRQGQEQHNKASFLPSLTYIKK